MTDTYSSYASNYFDPQQAPASQRPTDTTPTPPSADGLTAQWRGWLNDPGNRAALLQFGVNMLQPIGPGDNVLSAAGRAAGAGGEAASRVAETEAKRTQEQSLADYRATTAGARETTAGAAETKGTAAIMNATTRAASGGQRSATPGQILNARVQLQRLYEKYRSDFSLTGPRGQEPLSLKEFINRDPEAVKLMQIIEPQAKPTGANAAAPAAPTSRSGVTPGDFATPAKASNDQIVLQQAREAIARGADPEQVKARLEELGVNPGAL